MVTRAQSLLLSAPTVTLAGHSTSWSMAAAMRRPLRVVECTRPARSSWWLWPSETRVSMSAAATREALVNVAKHSGVTAADLYTEVTPDRVSVFVRDRGAGFDADAVPSDRRGLRDSVTGRIARLGGTALIRSAPGEGTEVELALPRAASS